MDSEQTTGGISALRGFRKQFLHMLNSILSSETGHFYPEILEDFSVHDSTGKLTELVQVKDYKHDLTFSELETFLQRATQCITRYPDVQFVLASYGELGPELQQCIGADEATLKKTLKKKKNGEFNTPEMLKVFQQLKHRPLNEEDERNSIQRHLTQLPLPTGDWQTASDVLMQELYIGAEKKKGYTRHDLLERLQLIGQYLASRKAHHEEWGTSIIPLLLEQEVVDREQLRKTFYEGVSVSWRHILSDLDVARRQHLNAIQEEFKKTKIVIVHGASGQGKSALAYRYLHDFCLAELRYEIRDLSTGKRALEVAAALAGYGIPLTFYVDASHNDKGLPEFLRRIHEMQHVSCLVTIREEDWRMTGITSADITFADIELVFNRQEAQELYEAWGKNVGGYRFPDFEQAWAKFSEAGPLLEFVHLLTHTENLRHRLKKQYDQIANEVDCQQRPENDLKLIRQVAVAGACGARIDLVKLANLPGNETLKQSIDRLEKEYLLRYSTDSRHLTGLHPVRSEILSSIIADPVLCPWKALALECLPLLEDADVEIFLLHIFHFHPDATNAILSYLNMATYETWLAANSVLRSLLWLGMHEYIHNNDKLIKQIYDKVGGSWFSMLDIDFVEVLEGKSLGITDLLTEEGQKEANQWQRDQLPKYLVFARIDNWLQQVVLPRIPAYDQEKDWKEFGQVAYWAGFRGINRQIEKLIDWNALCQTVKKLHIDTLAVLIYGLWQALSKTDDFIEWHKDIRQILLDRYRKETNTPYLEEQDGVVRAHFIVPIDNDAKTSKQSTSVEKELFHALAMCHVETLAQLVPDCTGYGCKGYGHQVVDIEYSYDETMKTNIPASLLKPSWVLHVNKTARILGSHMFRPATWQEYSIQMFAIRKDLVSRLDELRRKLVKYFRSKGAVHELSRFPNTTEWKKTYRQVLNRPIFPVEALDQFGYTEENQEDTPTAEDHENRKTEMIISAYLKRYQSYLQAARKYFNSISNFLHLAESVMLANAYLGKAETQQRRIEIKQQLKELNFKTRKLLPAFNLSESIRILPQFQSSFRQHFSSLIDCEELSRLELQEIKTLDSLWPLWFCFETTPSCQLADPEKTALDQLRKRKKNIRNKLVKAFKKSSTDSIKFNILSDSIQFNIKPALWITIDGENPVEVYVQLDKVYNLMRNSFGCINMFHIDHFALNFQWHNIVIMPICKGKLFESKAWIISIEKFIDKLCGDQELSIFNRILQKIEQETLDDLNLKLWEPELLNDAKLFFQSGATLQVLLRHLVQVGDMQNLDETGTEIVQSWFEKMQGAVRQELQQLLDKYNLLHNQVVNGDNKTAANEYLKAAYGQLVEIYDKLVPEALENGKAVLSCEAIKKWQEQLLSVQDEAFFIYLCCCGYVINNS